jgi:hypothetical protein
MKSNIQMAVDVSRNGRNALGIGVAVQQKASTYFSSLVSQGLCQVVRHPLRGDVFIDVSIEGQRFKGAIAREPYIANGSGSGDCSLGVCCLAKASRVGSVDETVAEWGICKYRNQLHFPVRLSATGMRTLAMEFGLKFENLHSSSFPETDLDESLLFFESKAYSALVEWAKAHPTKIRAFEPGPYLGCWSLSATIDAGLNLNKTQRALHAELQMRKFGWDIL